MSTFGTRLREAREAKGWTQGELADKLEVAQPFVSQLENGRRRPTPALMKRITTSLGVSREELLVIQDESDVKASIINRKLKGLSPESLEKIEDYVNYVRQSEQGR